MKKSMSGFTIVELLIVIVVIAILAAIMVVAFNGVQDRARASAASQALSSAVKKIKYWQAEQDTTNSPNTLALADVNDDDNVTYQYNPNLNGTYCITATVANQSYRITGTSNTPTKGGCAGHGVGGVAAITNLVTNPSFEAGTTGSWGANGAYTAIAVGTGAAPNGSRFLRVNRTVTPGDSYAFFASSVIPPANSPYTLSFWMWADTTTSLDNTILFRTQNAGGCCVNIATLPAQTISTTPTRFVLSGNTGNNPTGGLQIILRTSPTIGQNINYDGFMITAGSTPYTYADGNTDGWIWSGMVNNSSSTGPQV